MTPAIETTIRRRLARHARAVDRLLEQAERALDTQRFAEAYDVLRRASAKAWLEHTGAFVHPALEQAWLRLGREALPEALRAPARKASPRRVLHVLTQAAMTGGHTRLVWRWLEHDTGRRHDVVLTDQGPVGVPPWLESAAAATGGQLSRLDGDFQARAIALRQLAWQADLVVLHTHPHDGLPLVAFAGERPSVVVMNHADHVFWLGAALADAVACIRQQAIDHTIHRRGVAPDRCVLLPIPIALPQRTCDRDEARRRLGLEAEATLILTVAAAAKFNPLHGAPAFIDTVLPVLEAHPTARLVVVGPPPRGRWARAERATGGQLRAVGERPDAALFYQAADIYAESFPLGSMTALLEAGSYGLPLVGLAWHPGAARHMAPDDPGLDGVFLQATEVARFQADLSALIANPEQRRMLGEQTARQVRATHAPESWRASIETLYARTAGLPPTQPGPVPLTVVNEHDLYLDYFFREQKRQQVFDILRHPSVDQLKAVANRLRMYR